MALDYSIALGVKPPQLESPINQMAKVYELQNAAQSNQLNRMKMDEYTRGVAETSQIKNALTNLNPASPTYKQDRQNAFALQGLEGLKTLSAIEREEAQTATAGVEATGKKVTNIDAIRKHSAKSYQDIIGRPSEANVNALYEDAVDSGLYPPEALVGMKQRSQQILSVPAPIDPKTGKPDYSLRQQYIMQMNLEADKLLPKFESQQNVMVNGVPTSRILSIDQLTNKARTLEGSAAPTYNKPAASTVVNVDNKQESEFNKQLGGGQAKKVLEDKGKAEDAAQILATNQVAKNLLDKGMLTGVGAEFFTTLNQGLSQAGIDFGLADAAQNSQAYGALMAKNTATIIKNFGAGTGISDADRIYAKQAAAGDITMDENAIRKIIMVNDRVAKAAIAKHNKNVSRIKTNIPLTVNPEDYGAGIPEGRASTSTAKKGRDTLTNIMGF
jgi:hypothetical protein